MNMWRTVAVLVAVTLVAAATACGTAAAVDAPNDGNVVLSGNVQAQETGEVAGLTDWATQADCEAALISRAARNADGQPAVFSSRMYALQTNDGIVVFSPSQLCREQMQSKGMDPLDVWIYRQVAGEREHEQRHESLGERIRCVDQRINDLSGGFSVQGPSACE